jgi:hypothetical protein
MIPQLQKRLGEREIEFELIDNTQTLIAKN